MAATGFQDEDKDSQMAVNRPRLAVAEAAPDAYRAMLAWEECLRDSALPADLRELVRLRASQINGCAFCVGLHGHAARQLGVPEAKLLAVAAWRAAPFFSPPERAALALADAATRLGDDGVPESTWQQAAAHFGDSALAALVMTIAAVNAWNRIAVSTGLVPDSHQAPPAADDG